jgi:hypothetical protein
MTIDERNLPFFLGMSHRTARRGYEWDLLGVTKVLLFPFFPQRLTGLQCVVGLNRGSLAGPGNYAFRWLFTEEGEPTNYAWMDQNISVATREAGPILALGRSGFAVPPTPPEEGATNFGWELVGRSNELDSIEILPIPAPPLILWKPCSVLVEVELNGNRYPKGELLCGFVPPPPLSDEERRAIASRPGAKKSVVFQIECPVCRDKASYYSLLNPFDTRPSGLPASAMPLHKAPTTWTCSCGHNPVDLSYLKRGLHDLFRRARSQSSEASAVNFTPLYEAGRIQNIIEEYEQLIESASEEEPVQKYLEEHPVLWAFLSPAKILHKPPVLTKKKADFGILTSQKVFYLVEIEKPTTRLTNQDDSISGEIQKGANQIRDWQLVVGDHRLALFSELGLKEGEVHEVRYLLIGGLARRTTATGLTKLRRTPFAQNTDFYCFDELGSFLHTLAAELGRL